MSIEILEYFDLAKYFDIICGASTDFSRNTKEAVIAHLLSQCDAKSNAVMVGDTAYDVIGAKAHNIPCIGVSTLEALAENLVGFDGILCPVMNARRNQVYNALFECKNGVITRLCEDRAIALTDLDTELASLPSAPVYLVGDGYDLAISALKASADRIRKTPVLLRTQNAYSVAQVARLQYERGVRTSDSELVPVYLRPCQAERERMERLEKENATNI
jgi:tRNA threonylcarbamoyladenosine biosynthesis protein TsaB